MFAFVTRTGNDYLGHHSQQIPLEQEPAQSHRHTEPPRVHQQHREMGLQSLGRGPRRPRSCFLACPALRWQKEEMRLQNSTVWDLTVLPPLCH